MRNRRSIDASKKHCGRLGKFLTVLEEVASHRPAAEVEDSSVAPRVVDRLYAGSWNWSWVTQKRGEDFGWTERWIRL